MLFKHSIQHNGARVDWSQQNVMFVWRIICRNSDGLYYDFSLLSAEVSSQVSCRLYFQTCQNAKLKMVLSSVENVKRMLSGVPTPKCQEGGPLFGKVGWLFLVLHLQCLALTFIILYMKCRYKLHDEKEPPLPNISSTEEDKWKARGKFAWGWF